MFEALKQTPPSPSGDIVIAAQPGFSVLTFAPKPDQKPAASLVTELVRDGLLPVTSWLVRDGVSEPLTFCAPPAGAARYLMVAGKYYALDGSNRSWANYDLFHEHLLQTWRAQRREAEPKQQQGTHYAIEAGASRVAIPRTSW